MSARHSRLVRVALILSSTAAGCSSPTGTEPVLEVLSLEPLDVYVPGGASPTPLRVDSAGQRIFFADRVSTDGGATFTDVNLGGIGALERVEGWIGTALMVRTAMHPLAVWDFDGGRVYPLTPGAVAPTHWATAGVEGPVIAATYRETSVYVLARDGSDWREVAFGEPIVSIIEAGDVVWAFDDERRPSLWRTESGTFERVEADQPILGSVTSMPDGRLLFTPSGRRSFFLAVDGSTTQMPTHPTPHDIHPVVCDDGTIVSGEFHTEDDGATWQTYPVPTGLPEEIRAELRCDAGRRVVALISSVSGDTATFEVTVDGDLFLERAGATSSPELSMDIAIDGTATRELPVPISYSAVDDRWHVVGAPLAAPFETPSGAWIGQRHGVLWRSRDRGVTWQFVSPTFEGETTEAIDLRTTKWMRWDEAVFAYVETPDDCVGPPGEETCTRHRYLLRTRDDGEHLRVLSDLVEVSWQGNVERTLRWEIAEGAYEETEPSDTLLRVLGVLPDGRLLANDGVSRNGALWTRIMAPEREWLVGLTPEGRTVGYDVGHERELDVFERVVEDGRVSQTYELTLRGASILPRLTTFDAMGRLFVRCGSTFCATRPLDDLAGGSSAP